MSEPVVIRHRLTLLLRLVDTVTGYPVEFTGGEFRRDGSEVRPVSKGGGNYVLTDSECGDCRIEVKMPGYEAAWVTIVSSALNPELPAVEVDLIPLPERMGNVSVQTLRGALPGLSSLDAVNLNAEVCRIRSYEPRRKLLTVLNPSRTALDEGVYAAADSGKGFYEPLRILRQLSENEYLLAEKPAVCSAGTPIVRVLAGNVEENGAYLLRVAGGPGRWLLRGVRNGKAGFCSADFGRAELPLQFRQDGEAPPERGGGP